MLNGMSITDDRKFIHDLRNSVMVVQNLTKLIREGKMKDADREHAYRLIDAECEKVLEMCKKGD